VTTKESSRRFAETGTVKSSELTGLPSGNVEPLPEAGERWRRFFFLCLRPGDRKRDGLPEGERDRERERERDRRLRFSFLCFLSLRSLLFFLCPLPLCTESGDKSLRWPRSLLLLLPPP
jgi:hypothetical protein